MKEVTPDGYVDVRDSQGGDDHNSIVVSVDAGDSLAPANFFIDEKPSNAPSVSAAPSGSPSDQPSVSAVPSKSPSDQPSVSMAPSDLLMGSISGTVQLDEDNDDIPDVSLSGITLTLLDHTGAVIATTVTDADGNYSFNDIPKGQYTIEQTNIDGYFDVSDTDGPNDSLVTIDLGGGEHRTGADFVDEPPRTVSGLVLEDMDNNDSGDEPIAGVTVELYNESGDVLLSTTTTDATGTFTFSGLAPGTYTVKEVTPDGYVDVRDSQGGNDHNSIVVSVDASDSLAPANFFIDERPSNAPSVSAAPSGSPSDQPSVSAVPSKSPSDQPSVSSVPSRTPTSSPSGSSAPSITPTDTPSFSANPTSTPSDVPSFSAAPSGSPSDQPSVSAAPSKSPSDQPSVSMAPSDLLMGSISGTVALDEDNDDVPDVSLSGITLTLMDDTGAVIATTVTDADGNLSLIHI